METPLQIKQGKQIFHFKTAISNTMHSIANSSKPAAGQCNITPLLRVC